MNLYRSFFESSQRALKSRAACLWPVSPAVAALGAALLALCLGMAAPAHGQVTPAADRGGLSLSAGVMGSGYTLQYGDRKMLGIAAFVDAQSRRRLGAEAEGRLLTFHRTADVHASTYLAGPRYHLDLGRFEPYAKALIGEGLFTFPYDYAHGHYLVVASGGGLDIRINRFVKVRAIDAEYQMWPQFTFGSMSSVGISAGLRFRIF